MVFLQTPAIRPSVPDVSLMFDDMGAMSSPRLSTPPQPHLLPAPEQFGYRLPNSKSTIVQPSSAAAKDRVCNPEKLPTAVKKPSDQTVKKTSSSQKKGRGRNMYARYPGGPPGPYLHDPRLYYPPYGAPPHPSQPHYPAYMPTTYQSTPYPGNPYPAPQAWFTPVPYSLKSPGNQGLPIVTPQTNADGAAQMLLNTAMSSHFPEDKTVTENHQGGIPSIQSPTATMVNLSSHQNSGAERMLRTSSSENDVNSTSSASSNEHVLESVISGTALQGVDSIARPQESLNTSLSTTLGSNMSQVPPQVLDLLKQQDEQLRSLRGQLDRLLAAQAATTEEKRMVLPGTTSVVKEVSAGTGTPPAVVETALGSSGGLASVRNTCSVAINTSIWWPNGDAQNSHNSGENVSQNQQDIQKQMAARSNSVNIGNQSGSMSPDRGSVRSVATSNQNHNATMINDTCSFGELHLTQQLQDRSEESMVSDIIVDMPAYTPHTPDK